MCRNSMTIETYNFLKNYCDGKQNCPIDATPDKFGRECNGVKYLDITYDCVAKLS